MIKLKSVALLFGALLATSGVTLAGDQKPDQCAKDLGRIGLVANSPGLPYEGGLGFRNYISAFPDPKDLQAEAELTALGFINWGITVVPVKNIQGAVEFLAKYTSMKNEYADPILRPLFLIDAEGTIASVPSENLNEKLDRYYQLLKTGTLFYLWHDEHADPVFYPLADRARFSYSPDRTQRLDFPMGEAFSNLGWAFPLERGLLLNSDLLKSKTYKNLMYEARRHYRKGVRFRFNQDFEKTLKALAEQERRGQTSSMNRFLKESVRERFRKLYASGYAFAFEAFDESVNPPKLLGGIVGLKFGAILSINTVHGEKIDWAKILGAAFSDIAEGQDFSAVDMGMASSYSTSIKSGYHPNRVILEQVKMSDPSKKFELPASMEWVPELK